MCSLYLVVLPYARLTNHIIHRLEWWMSVCISTPANGDYIVGPENKSKINSGPDGFVSLGTRRLLPCCMTHVSDAAVAVAHSYDATIRVRVIRKGMCTSTHRVGYGICIGNPCAMTLTMSTAGVFAYYFASCRCAGPAAVATEELYNCDPLFVRYRYRR